MKRLRKIIIIVGSVFFLLCGLCFGYTYSVGIDNTFIERCPVNCRITVMGEVDCWILDNLPSDFALLTESIKPVYTGHYKKNRRFVQPVKLGSISYGSMSLDAVHDPNSLYFTDWHGEPVSSAMIVFTDYAGTGRSVGFGFDGIMSWAQITITYNNGQEDVFTVSFPPGDITRDGIVNLEDYTVLAENWLSRAEVQ